MQIIYFFLLREHLKISRNIINILILLITYLFSLNNILDSNFINKKTRVDKVLF